jgi:hypothetical protein
VKIFQRGALGERHVALILEIARQTCPNYRIQIRLETPFKNGLANFANYGRRLRDDNIVDVFADCPFSTAKIAEDVFYLAPFAHAPRDPDWCAIVLINDESKCVIARRAYAGKLDLHRRAIELPVVMLAVKFGAFIPQQ